MFRWYSKEVYSWSWDSREDCWVKSCYAASPSLQYREGASWKDVPFVVERVVPPKPKD